MAAFSISHTGDELLVKARTSQRGLATARIPSDNQQLHQVLLVLTAEAELADHPNPGEAVLTVHSGQVQLICDDLATTVDLSAGQSSDVPQAIHRVVARTDAVCVLSLIHRGHA